MSTKETAAERIARMKREKEQAAGGDNAKLVSQLTHESADETNFKELAQKLKEHHGEKRKPFDDNAVKFTFYIDKDVLDAFIAICTERGDKRRFGNEAIRDFVVKKARERDIK